MLVNFLVGGVSVLFFLFIFWERLNEDYSSDLIFRAATLILIGLVLGFTISRLLFPEWFFWLEVLSILMSMALVLFKYKLRFYETFEALLLGFMPVVSFMFFKDSIRNSSLYSFLAFVGSLILIFLAYWFDMNYKNFPWYKSGRIGFAGISTAILFFFTRTVIAIFGVTMISYVGRFEPYISGLTTLILIGLLINLGKNK